VALASLALTATAFVRALLWREKEIAELCAFVIVALLGNAVICGVLSNPHARYQSRIVWLATLCAIVAAQHTLFRETPVDLLIRPIARRRDRGRASRQSGSAQAISAGPPAAARPAEPEKWPWVVDWLSVVRGIAKAWLVDSI
jgi:hypothetical protein